MSELPTHNKRYLSLRFTIWFGVILIYTTVFVASFIWFYHYASERVLNLITEDLSQTIQGVVKGMNAVDAFVTLYEDEKTSNPLCDPKSERAGYYPDNPLYWQHVTWLKSMEDVEPQARVYTYVKGEKPGEVIMIGSSGAVKNPQEGFKFCQSYISKTTRIYEGLSERVDVWKPYKDADGEWITTYSPIKQGDRIVGAIGVDIKASYVRDVQGGIIRNGLFAFVILYVLIFVLVYLMTGIVTRPIVKLAEVSQQIGEGNYDQDLDTINSNKNWQDEIDTLINTFKIMIGKVAQREQNLRVRVQQLEIMIDESKREKQVQEIVDSDFFQDLQQKAQAVRNRDKDAKKNMDKDK